MKPSGNQMRSVKLTIWITGALMISSLVLLAIGNRGGPEWVQWLGGLLCSSFLFMPALLLVIRPGLAVVWLSTCLSMMGRRQPFVGGPILSSPTVLEPSEWSKLKDGEKAFIGIIALMFFVFGVIVLVGMLTDF